MDFSPHTNMGRINIGLDVGYFNTKTQHTTIPSGYAEFITDPGIQDDLLIFQGKYYVLEEQRISHAIDKKNDETMAILSLFGIAKEIINSFNGNNHKATQEDIDSLDVIDLGVGLPPGSFIAEKEKTQEYYKTLFSESIKFTFNGLNFNIKLGFFNIYPQDFTAAATYIPKDGHVSIAKKYPDYYAIDIGGHTVDLVPVINRKPSTKACTSLPMGVLHMYDDIITNVRNDTGININMRHVEMVLRNIDNGVLEECVPLITRRAAQWAQSILVQLKQLGVEPKVTPIVFIGGGSKLLRNYLEDNPLLGVHEFISNPNENAVGYAKMNELCMKAS